MSLFLSCQARYARGGASLLNYIADGDGIKIINITFNIWFQFLDCLLLVSDHAVIIISHSN